jgi:hypothetical protein
MWVQAMADPEGVAAAAVVAVVAGAVVDHCNQTPASLRLEF